MRACLAIVAVLASPALAKPLPKTMKVGIEKTKLVFTEGGITVPMMPDSEKVWDTVVSAELSDDGKTIEIKAQGCIETVDDPIEFSIDELEARIENVRGMQLHLKKKYADAIPHFAAAAKRDPAAPVYATNLLSAQAMGGKLDDADATLATMGAQNVPWFAWRLAVDPELKALNGRASTKPFTAPKPTKLAFKDPDKTIAVSPLGYVAVNDALLLGMGPNVDQMAIYDIKRNSRLLKLQTSVGCMDDPQMAESLGGGGCTKQDHAKEAGFAREASAVLGRLGFVEEPFVWVERPESDTIVSPDKTVQLAFKDDKLIIKRGKASSTVKADSGPYRVGFGKTVLVVQYRGMYGCGGADSRQFYSSVYALP